MSLCAGRPLRASLLPPTTVGGGRRPGSRRFTEGISIGVGRLRVEHMARFQVGAEMNLPEARRDIAHWAFLTGRVLPVVPVIVCSPRNFARFSGDFRNATLNCS
jgi:hypothetical protein